MSERETGRVPQARQATNGAPIGRRGLLAGAMTLAAMTATATIGRPALAAGEPDGPPMTPGFWLRVDGQWLQIERKNPMQLLSLVQGNDTDVTLQFRLAGFSPDLWDWQCSDLTAASFPDLPIRAVSDKGKTPSRNFVLEKASLHELSVQSESDGFDVLLYSDLTLTGYRLRAATPKDKALFN
jgi:hypothetical protein